MYIKQCRSVLELAVPAWSSGLTRSEVNQLERVQRAACSIILGQHYGSYKFALKKLNLQSLETRRKQICLTFAIKTEENEKFQNWFKVNSDHDKVSKPRACKENPNKRLQPVTFRTRRYEKSPIPYLTNLLNENT